MDIFNSEDEHIEIVSGNRENYIIGRSTDYDVKFASTSAHIQHRNLKYKVLNGIILCIGAIISAGLLFIRLRNGINTESTLIVLMLGIVLMYGELAKLFNTVVWDKEALYYARQFLEFDESENHEEKKAGLGSIDSIELKEVTLKYGENCAVDHVSLRLQRGDSLLLLGDNGAGKTSLLSLISGLRTPNSGEMIIKPEPFNGMKDMLDQTAYISQSFPQIAVSVKSNLFCSEATDGEVEEVLKKVGLWEKVSRSKKGTESIVGQDISFSKGEWQRFLVARLLVNGKRSLWILDEPTSAMDALHEEKILKMVHELAKEKILIIVTHRLGYCDKVGKIVRMEKGRIVAQGNFEEMMLSDPEFEKAYKEQKRLYEATV